MVTQRTSLPPGRQLDLLGWPLLGPFLKWRHARTALQIPAFALAALVVFDGLVGPQLAPKNLATVGVWLHYRGLVVLALLFAGNLFCMACPFMLPRQGGRWLRERLLGEGRLLPAPLRSKWLAIGLLVIFFYSYELFSLWASPWLTAWLVLGYFLVAFLVDTVFRGAAFCKHICPVGQFNFFGSLVSPLEIKVRDQVTCAGCRSKDCITAGPAPRHDARHADRSANARGCELWLFQPRKFGNMDCTFCLDCIHACPFDNIGVIGRIPTSELWTDPFRSGMGRFSRRSDLIALVSLFSFAAFVNAFAMIRPVYALQEQLARWLGAGVSAMRNASSPSAWDVSHAPGLAIIFLVGLIVLPAILVLAGGQGTRLLSGSRGISAPIAIRRYSYGLVPLGFGMWLAHYAFHFLTGGLTMLPVVQSFLADIGLYAGKVQWGLGALVPAEWLFPIEATVLYLGATGSLVAVFRIAQDHVGVAGPGSRSAVLKEALPWLILILLMLGAGLWILVQPMEMRGTMMFTTAGG